MTDQVAWTTRQLRGKKESVYHVTTRALDQGGVEPRLAVSVRPEGRRQYHYTSPPARQVKHYNFPIRNFDGAFYVQVHPFDPEYFAVKVTDAVAKRYRPWPPGLGLTACRGSTPPWSRA